MKFDPLKWNEVANGKEFECRQGMLHVMCSEAACVYIEAEGVEALAGVGTEVRCEIAQAFRFRVEAPEGARIFVANPARVPLKATGEVFTNADRMPMESGTMSEVTKALRLFKLEQQQTIRDMRLERRALATERERRKMAREVARDAEAHFSADPDEPEGEEPDNQEEPASAGSE